MPTISPLREASVLVVNLSRRYAGVSATIRALVPMQQRERRSAVLDRGRMGLSDAVGLAGLLRHGWRAPEGFTHRVWHARRALDLALGLFFRHVLGQPWRFVYTCSSPRRHGAVWRWLVNRSDAIIAVSERAASFLDRHDAVVPIGVDVDQFVPPADKAAAWRESGFPGRYGIGTFGRIRHSKGTDLFVDAMCALLPRHPDFTAVVAGFCKPADRAFREDLESRIAAAGLQERIVFLGDLAPVHIERWNQRVSLCVAPPRSEGFGMTPLEAMASGAAVVTSSEGYFPRMVVPGVNGEIVPTGDLPALTRAIEELICDPDTLLRLGESARRYVVEHHRLEREMEGIHAVYDLVLGRSRR